MQQFILTLFFLFSAFYLVLLLLIIWAQKRLRRRPIARELPKVSVVIAAKNEEQRITPTLKSLEKLDYPSDKLEIIIVDDASIDNTADVIEGYAKNHTNWYALRITEESDKFHAKKVALAAGVEKASGEIIFTTDADCEVPASWIRTMAAYFTPRTDMVLGYSPLKTGKGFLARFLDFDNLFSAIVVAAPTVLGFPVSSVGRNMAFRKEAYKRIGGYRALTAFKSGDDIHLTERMRDNSKGKIVFCADPETFVLSQPPATGRDIFYQQIRKNSKILDKSFRSAVISVLLFFAFVLFYTLPLFNPAWLTVWLTVWTIKFVLEFTGLWQAAHLFKAQRTIPLFPLMQVVYPLYVMVFGLLGTLHLYKWKR